MSLVKKSQIYVHCNCSNQEMKNTEFHILNSIHTKTSYITTYKTVCKSGIWQRGFDTPLLVIKMLNFSFSSLFSLTFFQIYHYFFIVWPPCIWSCLSTRKLEES